MKQITKEWIKKAEGDWAVAQRLMRARKYPSYSTACFQAHEAAEKYLKARLAEADIAFEKTMSLRQTMKLLFSIEPDSKRLQRDLSKLLPFTIDYLYPGKQADKAEAQEAMDCCRRVRLAVRQSFELPI
ncbi:MAG: HEPN domain-containing protein [Blastocatellia bacterium]